MDGELALWSSDAARKPFEVGTHLMGRDLTGGVQPIA
jgi:hypothetical protein